MKTREILDIGDLKERLRKFADDRNWNQYHTPKNLAASVSIEASELLEIFQWMTPEESSAAGDQLELKEHIGQEIADVLIYAVMLAEKVGVDIVEAIDAKLEQNGVKYPSVGARPNSRS